MAEILHTLGAEPIAVDTIVRRVYGDLSAALRLMANESVLAHLVKLRDEGRVREESARWRRDRGV